MDWWITNLKRVHYKMRFKAVLSLVIWLLGGMVGTTALFGQGEMDVAVPSNMWQGDTPGDSLDALLVASIRQDGAGEFSFEAAALVASGVRDGRELSHWLGRLDRVKESLNKNRWLKKKKRERKTAEKILNWMHKHHLKEYDYESSSLVQIMEDERFNCVGSTALYTILCRAAGLECVGLLTPSHVLARVRIGKETYDVETTVKDWFDYRKDMGRFKDLVLKFNFRSPQEMLKSGLDQTFYEYSYQRRELNDKALIAAVYFNRAADYFNQGDTREAERIMEYCVELDPEETKYRLTHEDIMNVVLVDLLNDARYEDGFAYATRGLQMYPKSEKLANNLLVLAARWMDELGTVAEFDSAIVVARALAEMSAVNPAFGQLERDIHARWIRNLLLNGDYDAALELAREALARHPNDAVISGLHVSAIVAYGQALLRKGRMEDALHLYDLNIAIYPANQNLRVAQCLTLGQLGLAKLDRGQYQEAIDLFKRGLEGSPDDIRFRRGLAHAYHRLAMELVRDDRIVDAYQAAEEGLRYAPDNVDLKDDYALLSGRVEAKKSRTD